MTEKICPVCRRGVLCPIYTVEVHVWGGGFPTGLMMGSFKDEIQSLDVRGGTITKSEYYCRRCGTQADKGYIDAVLHTQEHGVGDDD